RRWSPEPVSLARLVSVVCRRWKIEEDFQARENATGLDKGQVSTWPSWHRWSPAALVAYAFLAVATALERADGGQDADEAGLIPLSCHELLRLFPLLMLAMTRRDATPALAWATWRRRSQHRARTCHLHWHAYADTTP